MDHASPSTIRRGSGQTTTRRVSSSRFEAPSFQTERVVHPDESKVTCMDFSPISGILAVSHVDGSILLWIPPKKRTKVDDHGREYRFEGHKNSCEWLMWSPVEELLATCGGDACVNIYNTKGELQHKLTGHSRRVMSIAYSSTGKLLASGGVDKLVIVWNMLTMEKVHVFTGHTTTVLSVKFSFEDEHILSSCADAPCIVWDVSSGEHLLSLEGHDQRVTSAVFMPGTGLIATSSLDCTARLWDGKVTLKVFEDHVGDVNKVLFSKDGRQMCTCSNDNTILLYSMKTKALLFKLTGTSPITNIDYSPDSSVLAAVDEIGHLSLWATGNGELVAAQHRHEQAIEHVQFSKKGTMLATGDRNGKVVLWYLTPASSPLSKDSASSGDGKCIVM
eukprot:m.87692 g.87692  ORF g.87692 m.87692 type:complete len:390 (+) comp8791_c4_seq4:268-1437(+)